MHVTDTTVKRDLLLAADSKMRDLIASRKITASNAAMLLSVAANRGRREKLHNLLHNWITETAMQWTPRPRPAQSATSRH